MNSLHNVLFYPRLAVTSMKKNRGIYLPYLMAGGVMAGLLYVLDSVGVMVEASQMAGGGIMQVIVEICGSICTVFAVMILFYINSFVMKRRKKEFGLFCVLGMEKKHLGFVLFWEVLIALFVSLVMGITVGALFSQAMFLLLLKMVGLPGKLMFVIPLQSVGKTCLIYVAAFALVLVYDLGSVFKANPMELLRSSAQGEREPKTRWLMTVTGVDTERSIDWVMHVSGELISAPEGVEVETFSEKKPFKYLHSMRRVEMQADEGEAVPMVYQDGDVKTWVFGAPCGQTLFYGKGPDNPSVSDVNYQIERRFGGQAVFAHVVASGRGECPIKSVVFEQAGDTVEVTVIHA